jgi:PAS domain S-box-containing protein
MTTNQVNSIILAIDDNVTSLGVLTSYLRRHGFQIIVAQSGNEGLEKARVDKPDLILLDVMMPDMDGFETCRRLKASEETKDIPVIFSTALHSAQDKVRGFSSGGVDYVTKPFQIEEVLARVETHLSLRALQKNLESKNRQLEMEVAERIRGEEKIRQYAEDLQTEKQTSDQLLLEIIPKLRESEARFRAVVEHSSNGVIFMNAEGKINYVSPAYQQFLGFTPEEMVGHFEMEYVYPEDQERTAQKYHDFLQIPGAIIANEYRLQRKDGSYCWVETIAANLLDDPNVHAITLNQRDINERKRTEKDLQESEKRYRRITDSLTDYQYTVRFEDGQVVETKQSPTSVSMTGYTPEEFADNPNLWIHMVEPEDRKLVLERVEQILSGKEIPPIEHRIIRKDGAVRWVCDTIILFKDATGKLLSYDGVIKDITERKQADEALKISEEKFRAMIEQASEGFTLVDENGIIIEWNHAKERIWGLPREEVMGQAFCDVQFRAVIPERRTPERYEYLKTTLMDALRTGQSPVFNNAIEAELCRPDGEHIFIQQSIFPIKTDRGYRIASISLDITERKRAEEALQESEARFRAVIQTANDAIVAVDMRGIVIAWNAAAETIFGFSAEEVIGKSVDRIVPQKFTAQHRHGREHALVSDERQIVGKTIEGTGLTKDGREFPIEMSLAEWKTQAGSFFTAIIRNISERKQYESELQAIATLSAALRTAPTRAEMLPVIIEQLVILLNCEAASVEIIDPLTGDAVTEAAQGAWEPFIGSRQKSGTGINAIISQTRQPYYSNDLSNDPNFVYPELAHEGLRGGIGSPLIAQDNLIGFLWMGRKSDISEFDVRLLASVADIAANAIHRATLHEQTQKDAADLELAYDTTLEGWAHALELRDQETEGHTRRVVQMTVDLALAMGIHEGKLEHIRRGALLHDIGKMGIPDSILRKPGTLDEHEWGIMRQHPEYAYKLLEPINYLHPALNIPYCHHERWDGTGYPRRLKGEEIPLEARIFAIVDVWDALTSDRSYRKAWSKKKALTHIAGQSRKHFDPAIVEVFMKII